MTARADRGRGKKRGRKSGNEAAAGCGGKIPLAVKIPYTVFVLLLVPVYWREHGPVNFLWSSDVALLATCPALWLESRLLVSMMALAALLPDSLWIADFLLRLAAGPDLAGIAGTGYMFDERIPLLVRTLSLFHLPLPAFLAWLVHRLGYDRRALPAQTLLLWLLLAVSYLAAPPARNINLVHGLGREPQQWLPPSLYLALLMVLYPLILYLPAHALLQRLGKNGAGRCAGRAGLAK